jgi:hypothetical protein
MCDPQRFYMATLLATTYYCTNVYYYYGTRNYTK